LIYDFAIHCSVHFSLDFWCYTRSNRCKRNTPGMSRRAPARLCAQPRGVAALPRTSPLTSSPAQWVPRAADSPRRRTPSSLPPPPRAPQAVCRRRPLRRACHSRRPRRVPLVLPSLRHSPPRAPYKNHRQVPRMHAPRRTSSLRTPAVRRGAMNATVELPFSAHRQCRPTTLGSFPPSLGPTPCRALPDRAPFFTGETAPRAAAAWHRRTSLPARPPSRPTPQIGRR
jgi:hypothetical protein